MNELAGTGYAGPVLTLRPLWPCAPNSRGRKNYPVWPDTEVSRFSMELNGARTTAVLTRVLGVHRKCVRAPLGAD